MSFTVEDVARAVVNRVATDAGLMQIGNMVSDRYRDLASSARFEHLATVGELELPARYNDGTVDATRGSTTIDGTGTTFTSSMVGRHIRVSTNWYLISAFVSTTELTLATNFAEDDVSGGSYDIVQRHVTLPDNVKHLDKIMVHMRQRRPIKGIGYSMMEARHPERILVSSDGPWEWAEVRNDVNSSSLQKVVEFYPYNTDTELIVYPAWTAPSTLDYTDVVPGFVEFEALVRGGMASVYNWEMSQALKKSDHQGAAVWRNEMNSSETRWQRHVREAIKNDRGPDGVTLVREFIGIESFDESIPTARGFVIDRWD